MRKILLVEDEKNFGMVLKDYLGMNGFEVTLCENGEQGIETFQSNKFDLCILDVMMPKKDGFTLSAEIKNLNKNTPIIFLTAKSMRDDIVKGYKLGADDYITKPFDSEVLLLKINVILNRHVDILNMDETFYEIGIYSFDCKLRILKSKESEIKLSPKESALLNLLCQHKNAVMPREKALKQIWEGENYFTGRSMDVYIVKLRKHLEADKNLSIENIHGSGYCLKVRG